jgi:hypothetical protein
VSVSLIMNAINNLLSWERREWGEEMSGTGRAGRETSEGIVARNHVEDPHLSWQSIGIPPVVGISSLSPHRARGSRGMVIIAILVINRVPSLAFWLDRATDHSRDLERGNHHLGDTIWSVEKHIVHELERKSCWEDRREERWGTLHPRTERARSWTLMRG